MSCGTQDPYPGVDTNGNPGKSNLMSLCLVTLLLCVTTNCCCTSLDGGASCQVEYLWLCNQNGPDSRLLRQASVGAGQLWMPVVPVVLGVEIPSDGRLVTLRLLPFRCRDVLCRTPGRRPN